jgi:hypothetical protein
MNINQRAQQIWSLLLFAAEHRQTLTYSIVSRYTGLLNPGIGGALFPIQRLCESRGLPKLTSLVVQQDSGMPGEGLQIKSCEFPGELQRIFSYDWSPVNAPSEEDFANA